MKKLNNIFKLLLTLSKILAYNSLKYFNVWIGLSHKLLNLISESNFLFLRDNFSLGSASWEYDFNKFSLNSSVSFKKFLLLNLNSSNNDANSSIYFLEVNSNCSSSLFISVPSPKFWGSLVSSAFGSDYNGAGKFSSFSSPTSIFCN